MRLETVKIEVLRVEPEYYCARVNEPCTRNYTCIDGNDVCPYLIVKALDKKLHETILKERGEME